MKSLSGNLISTLRLDKVLIIPIPISLFLYIYPSILCSSPPAFRLCHTQQMLHSFESRGSSRPIPPPVRLFPPLSITASLGGINLARANCSLSLMVTGLIKHDGFASFALVLPPRLCLSLSGSSWFSGCCRRPSCQLPDEASAAVACVGSAAAAY